MATSTATASALLLGAMLVHEELALVGPLALPGRLRERYQKEERILRDLAAQVSGLEGPVKLVGPPRMPGPDPEAKDCLGVDGPALARIATALEAIAENTKRPSWVNRGPG